MSATQLKIWTDHEDLYIAATKDEAALYRDKLYGNDADAFEPLVLANDPLTMYPDGGPVAVTKTQAEWITEAGSKAGYFASSNC